MLKTSERFKEWSECLKVADSFLNYLEANPSLAGTKYSRYMIAISLHFPELIQKMSLKDGLYKKAEQEFSLDSSSIERSIRYLLNSTPLEHFEEVFGYEYIHVTIKQFFWIANRFILAYPQKLEKGLLTVKRFL